MLASDTFAVDTPGPNAGNIPQGIATVDGDISDWDGATWRTGTLQMGYVTGAGTNGLEDLDLVSTHWAVRWNANGRIYAVVQVVDTNHQFQDDWVENGWHASDRVEFYVHGENNTGARYYDSLIDAQQYVIGVKASDNSDCWIAMGYNKGTPESMGLAPEYACSVNGDTITYEVSLPVFESFGGYATAPTTPTALAPGINIGFDIVVGSRVKVSDSDQDYYMVDETGLPYSSILTTHKADGCSSVMQEFTLVPEPATMSMLTITALSLMIPRKK